MTELRKRMIECLQLRGLSERTQDSYVRAVRQLAEHYHKSPDLISEEELRQYFLNQKDFCERRGSDFSRVANNGTFDNEFSLEVPGREASNAA